MNNEKQVEPIKYFSFTIFNNRLSIADEKQFFASQDLRNPLCGVGKIKGRYLLLDLYCGDPCPECGSKWECRCI